MHYILLSKGRQGIGEFIVFAQRRDDTTLLKVAGKLVSIFNIGNSLRCGSEDNWCLSPESSFTIRQGMEQWQQVRFPLFIITVTDFDHLSLKVKQIFAAP